MEVQMLQSLVFSVLLSFSGLSFAKTNAKLTVSNVEIVEIETPDTVLSDFEDKNVVAEIGEVISVVDSLIALGKKVYPIIEAGKPVLSSNLPVTHVLPKVAEVTDYDLTLGMMENWQFPKTKSYKVIYKNPYGMEVIKFVFTVHFQYGGSYEGKGKYLTGVFVSATDLTVAWGFEFSAATEVMAISNMGSFSHPVAGLSLKLNWSVKTLVMENQSSQVFHVTGDGKIE